MLPDDLEPRLGARWEEPGRVTFRVWAPLHERLELRLHGPRERAVALRAGAHGIHASEPLEVEPGALYTYRLSDGRELPDPASRRQPRGVHGPSAVPDPPARPGAGDAAFRPPALDDLVTYELHVGTFTPAGTLDAAREHLAQLVELGVNAVELMPLAPFPGRRGWGYDGTYPFAVHEAYGGPAALRRFVDACHALGLAVLLDVVHNHLGPDGNYLPEYAPVFGDRYHTPWGRALDFDGSASDGVRRFFCDSALSFLEEHHVDGFRLDAVHAILDTSARPFLRELAAVLHAAGERRGRPVLVIAESDRNDPREVRPVELGGLGLDAQWCDDFHHALHALLTGERQGYYEDFGALEDFATAWRQGYVYDGRWSAFRGRRHGDAPHGLPARRLIVCTQNHDQVGNRARGDRLDAGRTPAERRLAACALLLSPYPPLLFMGQEYGETAPFPYFTDHEDEGLARAVREGRRREFAAFGWRPEQVPDPQDAATFEAARLDPARGSGGPGDGLRALYRELLRLRREHPVLRRRDRERQEVVGDPERRLLRARRWDGAGEVLIGLSFAAEPVSLAVPAGGAPWSVLLDSEDPRFGGGGPERREAGPGGALELAPAAALVLERPRFRQ